MKPRFCWFFIVSASVSSIFALNSWAQERTKKEIDVGFAPLEAVKPILDQVLSPQGKFVMLPAKGSVMVIDDLANVVAAEAALSAGALPNPQVRLNVAFQTGLPPRRSRIEIGREVYFPTAWDPPQIPNVIFGPGVFPITPAHPTGFVKRHIGVVSDTTSYLNPDGSVTVDVNMENTEFEGFINYGSAILPAGAIGTIPVGQAGNPAFFQPLIPNNILMPVISTTRISTSVVVRPQVNAGVVTLDMMPRLTVHGDTAQKEPVDVDLKQFHTQVAVANNGLAKVYGFQNASEDFNRNFLGAKDPSKGSTAIVVKAEIAPGKAAPSAGSTASSPSPPSKP